MRKVRLTGRQMQVLQEMTKGPKLSSSGTYYTFLRLSERGLIEYVEWTGYVITEAGRAAIAPYATI